MTASKIACTSDLHLPITSADAIVQLARDIAEFAPAALAVLGDIGESLGDIERCLRLLADTVGCPVLVVAGNHDLWLPPNVQQRGDSWTRFQEDLPATVARAGCTWLEGSAYRLGGAALAGTIAWYDYSAIDPSLQASAAECADMKRYFNVDAARVRWPYSDPEFAARIAEPFLATLDRLEADATVRQTVVLTHVPLLECQMCRKPDDQQWGFSNAYFGNLTLGEAVLQRRKVTHIISGHTHVGRHALAKLTDGRTVEARVLDSQYGRPAWVGLTLPG